MLGLDNLNFYIHFQKQYQKQYNVAVLILYHLSMHLCLHLNVRIALPLGSLFPRSAGYVTADSTTMMMDEATSQ